jgi:6,7-dimethyl-8-ribityllumazine synthase
MSRQVPTPVTAKLPARARVAIVAARFNIEIVDELLNGCQARLLELGLAESKIEIHRIPGAFELPATAQALAQTKKFAAIICLGCVIRGDTPHFDYVAGQAAAGIQQVAINQSLPIIFGVLTTNTHQQALDRIGGVEGHAGRHAAEAAVEMISVMSRIRR